MNTPDLADIDAAAIRIAPYAVVTPVMRSEALDTLAGAQLSFKCENLQRGGAFKFRGACNAVWSLDHADAQRGVVTHSSGNHGTALALAARTRGIPAHVIVPDGAVRAKLALIEAAGAVVHRCAATQAAREAAAADVERATGAVLVHPYADARVIAGQGTLVREFLRQAGHLDVLITPVGGGGLASGVALAARALDPTVVLHAAEPTGAADAFASLQAGERRVDFTPDTVCDGLRAAIGVPNFDILKSAGVTVATVTDAECIAAMRLLWSHLRIVVEVSSATVFAAVLKYPQRFGGQHVGLVLTGGNVDLDALPWL